MDKNLIKWKASVFAGGRFFQQNHHFLPFFQHVQSDPPTAKSLSALIVQMIQFQEDSLAKNTKNPSFPRLPVSFYILLRLFKHEKWL